MPPLILIYALRNPNTTISIPLTTTIGGTISIDWGDGGVQDLYNPYQCTYTTRGIKTITISGNVQYLLYSGNVNTINKEYLISCRQFGNVGLEQISFGGAIRLISVPVILPSSVTNISTMFENATSFNQNISSWNVTNVTDMRSMFKNATSFNHNLSSWNVSNVTNMYSMFENATSFNQNVSSWIVSNVTTMESAFKNTSLSIENYNAILNTWSNLNNLQPCTFTNNFLVYTAEGSTGRQMLNVVKDWDIQDDILLNKYPIYVNESFELQYNHGIWNPFLWGGSILIFYKTTLLETIPIDSDTRNLNLKPITISDTGKIQLTINVIKNNQVVATEYVNLYVNPRNSPIPKPRMSMGSLFTNNAMVYYKPHSLAAGGIGGVRNYRKKSKKT